MLLMRIVYKEAFLTRLHTKEVSYYLLAIVSLGASLLFSYRAAIVYYTVFLPMAGHVVAFGFGGLVFLTLGIAEFVASLQWSKKQRNWFVIIIVLIHDGGSIFYSIFTYEGASFLIFILGVGMTVICILPFVFGHWMQEFVPYLEREREERHADWKASFNRRLETNAIKQYEKEIKADREKLKRFAPAHIISLVEGTGKAIYGPDSGTLPERTAFPAQHNILSLPVTPASLSDAPVTDLEKTEETEEEWQDTDYKAETQPFWRGKTQSQ